MEQEYQIPPFRALCDLTVFRLIVSRPVSLLPSLVFVILDPPFCCLSLFLITRPRYRLKAWHTLIQVTYSFVALLAHLRITDATLHSNLSIPVRWAYRVCACLISALT